MKPEIKAAWVAALRSGKYKQGRLQLRNGDRFCCLGVLCNLHAQAHPEIAARQTDPTVYLGQSRELPIEVMWWAGLCGTLPRAGGVCLAFINDNGWSFKRIADMIEEYL